MAFLLQWNCWGVYCNYKKLLQLVRKNDYPCICLQELIFGSLFLPTTWGYTSFTSAIHGPHGRCGTLGMPIARDDLVELLRQSPYPFLLVGDFNICHPSWGDTVASLNAALLLLINSDLSLCCLNSGLPTHYHRSTDSFSCVDYPSVLLF